jgi:predicted ATP-dependent protease
MVNNKTYNNVVNTLLRLGEYHEQISTTSVGDIYDINLEVMEKFPLMHVNPTSVVTGDSQLTYNFQVFVMDMVSEKSDWQTKQHQLLTKLVNTENNEQEVFNQTLAICTDIIGMLRHSSRQSIEGVNDINEPIYFTQDQFTIEPFQERFDNLCCGFVFNIGVLVQNDFQTCNIPANIRGAGY